MKPIFLSNKKYEVLTPDGFKPFAGISLMGHKEIWRIETERGLWVECTHDHKFFLDGNVRTPLTDISIGSSLMVMGGIDKIVKKEFTGRSEDVFDLIEVENGHRFYANGILSSNCQFVTFEETLISGLKLAKLQGVEPIRKTGQIRWYGDIKPNSTYVISLDPSMGTGGDNGAVQVFELPAMIQIAEWQHNRTSIEGQLNIVMTVGKEIKAAGAEDIYWSVENNTLGEAALVVIRNTGEENFPGTMLHDPNNKTNGKRKGFGTTARSKMEACSRLKTFIEKDKITIHSKSLITELKTYVAKQNTFTARTGCTDDLISSLLLFIRMAEYISTWDDQASAAMNNGLTSSENGDDDMPMPFVFI